jgi:hypothetical protein
MKVSDWDAIPEFGAPQPDLPLPKPKVSAAYWKVVVAHAKAHHGQWIPLVDKSLTISRLQNVVWAMRMGSTANIPLPMREAGMGSRWYQGQFYFIYLKPESDPWNGEFAG